ncbi:MAG: CoB--CoM heterodisulfide reductase iron-sulfur subunit A family protein, partial [Desulfobacteraceae bacterium]|nr:CoB--CoM heterodisulfide reductase iron-sulfur subunit A family protein [Desulfobacteraceae bacterium]
ELQVKPVAMVIGGGIAGMSSAKNLAEQNYEVHVIEKEATLGGQANKLFHTYKDENIGQELASLIKDVENNEKVHIHLNTTLENVEGFVGNFTSKLSNDKDTSTLEHGVAVIATGAKAFTPNEYSFGKDDRIITSLDLDKKFIEKDASLKKIESAVFIQCVGSREPDRPYCSRVCCTHSIDNALELKKINPEMAIYILYRDIRTYGEREYKYQQAREAGIIFIRYSVDKKPKLTIKDGKIFIAATDHVLGRPMEIETDLVTLATAIVPNKDEKLANFFKVPLNEDGFFVERHAKLGPSEFATDGVFLCGLAHYPKPIDEAIAHGQAAASRAVTLLAKETVHTSGNVANIAPMECSSCGVCISICPYNAPAFETEGRFEGTAQINPVLCKGCGLCVASCRSGAIHLKGFDTNQILAQIFALNEAV